jgi:hypothetical protein
MIDKLDQVADPVDSPPAIKKLPDWSATDENDRREMIKWVNLELDRNFWRRLKKWNRLAHSPDNVKEVGDWFADLGPQVEQANRGNVEPLRKALPKYAKFIKPPKLGRGQRFPKIRDANLARLCPFQAA